METSSIVISPKLALIPEDLKSAFNGLLKMLVGTTIVFLSGFLAKYLNDPVGLIHADWRSIGIAYATLQTSTIVTFVYNLCVKWMQENKYIAS